MTPPTPYYRQMPDTPAAENPLLIHGERRKDSMAALISLIEQLTERVHEMSEKLDKHVASLPAEREQIIKNVLTEALPGGDTVGHRRYHEDVMASLEARTAFWIKMRDELAKWGLIGFLGWAGYALWVAFLQGPHK